MQPLRTLMTIYYENGGRNQRIIIVLSPDFSITVLNLYSKLPELLHSIIPERSMSQIRNLGLGYL